MEPGEVKLTKIEAAERQLSEAIKLFFEERDPVAIHVLASGAAQIAADLAKKQGLNAPFRDTEYMGGKQKQWWVRVIKSAENFFKHADRDPNGVLILPTEITRLYLADAASTLEAVGSEGTVEMEIYQLWFIHKYGRSHRIIAESRTFRHFDIPGTDWDNLLFFRGLIDVIRESRANRCLGSE
jgi:hypothetical protein